VGAVITLCALVAVAAEALIPVSIPAAFRSKATHSTEPVVYAHVVGEFRNMGMTDGHAVFEAGYDKPLTTEDWQFTNELHSATLHVLNTYRCDRPEGRGSSADAMCACTYRVMPHYTAYIDNHVDGGRVEKLRIDFDTGKAERHLSAGPSTIDPARGAAMVHAMAPEEVGRDVVAGIACVIRRQRWPGKGYFDHCITEDADKNLRPELRNRSLSATMVGSDGSGIGHWSRTDKVLLNAVVDSGVFAVPDGVTVKDVK
jgi:hypothetical protein